MSTNDDKDKKGRKKDLFFGWLVVLFYGVSNLVGLFNAELSHLIKVSNN